MAEFTGERLVPGQVDQDLWNEHYSRYVFASRLARRKRVLDVGCGTGYGSAELAKVAHRVIGIDVAAEAAAAASAAHRCANLQYVAAAAQHVPFPDAQFDLIVAFEVIEHLENWAELLSEARRLLAPGGQFVISTPNKLYYAESRRLSGPNPFHVHEFEFSEFREALTAVFPSVTIFTQNHTAGILFQPHGVSAAPAVDVSVERGEARPEDSHFFLAVCAMRPQTGAPTFAFLPAAANVLRERELHIQKLEGELAQKEHWLAQAHAERDEMLRLHAAETAERQTAQDWALKLEGELREAREEITRLQREMALEAADAAGKIKAYQQEVERKAQELLDCVALIDKAEATVIERTNWAHSLQRELEQTQQALNLLQSSRWVRFGRKIGVGPGPAG